jgi:hypothetical protein
MENLFAYAHPYALWSLWIELSLLPRLFLLIFGSVTVYTLVSSAVIMGRLTSLTRRRVEDLSLFKRSLGALLAWTANLGQLIAARSIFLVSYFSSC